VTIYLPVAVAKDRIANLDLLKKHRWWTIGFGLFFICTVPWVVYWQHAGIQTFLRGHHSESLNVILVIQAIVFSTSFISIGQETRRVILSNDEKVSTVSLLTGGLLTIFLGFSLLLLFACVYIRIPVSIGGGEPEQRDMWVSREALNVFDYCKGAPIPKDQQIQRFETQDPNIVFLPNLFVLHESKDNFIIWREKGRIVALPKAWIKTYEWPMPDHK